MLQALKKNPKFTPRRGPVVLAILDGVGYGKYADGDAVKLARTPVLDALMKNCPVTKLKAHGTAVGMPSDDDMGNSEVGTTRSAAAGSSRRARSWSKRRSNRRSCSPVKSGKS